MSLVHVERRGLQADRPQHAHPSDAEYDLLRDAGPVIPSVHVSGKLAVSRVILRKVDDDRTQGIGQDVAERDPDRPRLHLHGVVADLHGADHPFPLAVGHRGDRHPCGIVARVSFLLPAVSRDLLLEIPLPVEKRDAGKREAQIAGGFGVVACEYPEPSGIDPEAFVKSELGAEIGDRFLFQRAAAFCSPCPFLGHVRLEVVAGFPHLTMERRVLKSHPEFVFAHPVEDFHGIMVACFPDIGGEVSEYESCRRVPGPPEVVREDPEILDCGFHRFF